MPLLIDKLAFHIGGSEKEGFVLAVPLVSCLKIDRNRHMRRNKMHSNVSRTTTQKAKNLSGCMVKQCLEFSEFQSCVVMMA